MASQTTARESLTCAAFSYFAGGNTDLQEFSNIIYDYYFNDNETEIKKLSNNLPNSFNFNRMREEYKTKDGALVIDKKYPISQHKKDFPNGTLVKSETGEPTKLDGEIKSAYLTAKKLKESNIVGNLSQYMFFDQSTDFMQIVKDDALKKTLDSLDLPGSIGSDILSSVDVIAVKKSKVNNILKEFKDNITDSSVTTMDILNNLAWGNRGKNTFRTLTNKYFASKDMVGISLKKTNATKADISIVGTVSGAQGFEIYLDPYTEFLARASSMNRKELYDLISEMVEIENIDDNKIADGRTYFSIIYTLNYKKVNIMDKLAKFDLQIGRTGFNAKPFGKGAFVGGASYSVSTPIMKKYSKYNSMIAEIISIRNKAFDFAVNQRNIPSRIKSDYNSALREIRKKELVLYDDASNNIIKDFCAEYDTLTNNSKDSFQEYRIGVSKLCKNKTLTSPHGNLATLDKNSMLKNKKEILQNDYVHAQGLWIYTKNDRDMQNFLKKQVTLSLYGLMAKKGAKVFLSGNKSMLIEDAFVKEFRANNNRTKLAKVVTAPYILID
jgi:hypothetical protein